MTENGSMSQTSNSQKIQVVNNLLKMVHFNNKRIRNENKISDLLEIYKIRRNYMKKKALLYTFCGSLHWYNFFFNGKLTIIINLKCQSLLTNNSASRNRSKEGSKISVCNSNPVKTVKTQQ